ncbi:MAG: hypothetical protein KAS15_07240 [Nanoarchaeota archaeon]|nr:hypothetical protein [Nanoarchaeota archaeon]
MAEEISNKTLAVIVVAAIVITLGSTALIMRMGSPVITGMITEQVGTAQFNITSVVSIAITDSMIDFGAGSVGAGNASCVIDSDGAVGTGDWSPTSDAFIVENDGNVAINITVNASNVAADFIGGTGPAYKWITDAGEGDGSCTAESIDSYAEATTSTQMFCGNLGFASAADSVGMDLQLTIPSDATPGQKTSTVQFTASAY